MSYETLRRICSGYEGPTVGHWVRKIAQGYGVDEKFLMDGLDPRGDFEWTLEQATPGHRLEILMVTPQERVKLALDFLCSRYPQICDLDRLATASGFEVEELSAMIRQWPSRCPDTVAAMALARGINRLTGISLSWFSVGVVNREAALKPLLARFARAGVRAQDAARPASAEETRRLLQLVGVIMPT